MPTKPLVVLKLEDGRVLFVTNVWFKEGMCHWARSEAEEVAFSGSANQSEVICVEGVIPKRAGPSMVRNRLRTIDRRIGHLLNRSHTRKLRGDQLPNDVDLDMQEVIALQWLRDLALKQLAETNQAPLEIQP